MDSRSPSPVSQIQMVEDRSPNLIEDQSTGLTGQQGHSQPQFVSNVSHVTETRPETIDLTKSRLPDNNHRLRQDVLDHRPPSLPNAVRDIEPAKKLARPPSVGEDLNSGFSYQRPTMPALTFSRSPPHKPRAHRKPDEDLQKHDSAWDRRREVNTSDSVHIKSKDFDMLAGGTYPLNDRQLTSPNSTTDPVKPFSPPGDILAPFPGGIVLTFPPEIYHDSVTASADHAKSFLEPPKSYGTGVPDQTPEPGQVTWTEPATVDTAVSAPAVSHNKVNKVTKTKQNRRPKARNVKDGVIVQPNLGSAPSEEDLLNLLAYRYQKGSESKATQEAILQTKSLEVEELRRTQHNLERYLAESERNVRLHEKELGRYKEAIAKKVGKLTKFVNGLAKDHNQLRNDAKLMVEKHNAVRADGTQLAADIESVRALAQQWARKSSENPGLFLRDARQKINQLEEVLVILNRELEEKSGLLATERDRTVELEAKIKLAAGNHDEVKALIDSHHKGIIGKLDILPNIVELAHGDNVSGTVAELRIKVEECLGLLKTVHGSSDVLPELLQDILGPVRVACGEILASVKQTKKERKGSNEAISTLEASLKEDLRALKEGYNGAQSLRDELITLRESQAALSEKVRGREKALADAQERYAELQNDKQSLLARVSASEFKAEASQRENEGLRKTLSTLQQAEPTNTELEADLATTRKEVVDLQEKLQAQAGSVADLQNTIDRLESERAGLQAAVATLEQQKLMSEQESLTKCNEVRKELAASSKHAREMVVQEYGNKLHQMTEGKKEVDAEVEQLQYGMSQYKAQISELREKIGEKDRSLEGSKEQLQMVSERANTRDAEIQATKDDRAANAKLLKQALKKADGLQKRVASLTQLNSKSEGELATLRAKYEKAEKLQERVVGLYRTVGLGDGVAPLSMQMLDLLGEKILALKNWQPLSVTRANTETQIAMTKETQVPDTLSDNTKHSRRKVTRHASTENRNIREVRTPIGSGSEEEVSVVGARHREATVEVTNITHTLPSQETGTVSEPPIRPYEIDSTPAALVQETQTMDSFVPLWDIEAEAAHVPTSPFTDLSAFFPTSPLSSPKQWASPVREEESAKQSMKLSAQKPSSGKVTKLTSKDRVQTSSTPRHSTKDLKTNLERETTKKGQSSRNTLPPSQKMFSPAPDFSSPSTDHISRQKNPPGHSTSGGRTLKGTVKNGIFYRDNETEASPTGPRSQTSTKLPPADHDISGNKKPTSGRRVATRGILKKPNSTTSKKHGLEGAEVQANNAGSAAKRLKPTGCTNTSSPPTNSLATSAPKQSASVSTRDTHQHPYSPTAKKSGSFGQRRKRSQTSEGDSDRHHSK